MVKVKSSKAEAIRLARERAAAWASEPKKTKGQRSTKRKADDDGPISPTAAAAATVSPKNTKRIRSNANVPLSSRKMQEHNRNVRDQDDDVTVVVTDSVTAPSKSSPAISNSMSKAAMVAAARERAKIAMKKPKVVKPSVQRNMSMPATAVGPPIVHTTESKNMRVEVEEEEESIDQREGGEEAKSPKVVSPTSEGEIEENYDQAAVSRSAEHEDVKKPKFSFFGSILKLILRILVIAAFFPIYGLYNPSTSNEWAIQSATYVKRHVPSLFLRVDFEKNENLDNQSPPSKYVSDISTMEKAISSDKSSAAEDLSP